MTMTEVRKIEVSGMIWVRTWQVEKSPPLWTLATKAAPWSTARPSVRYRVYWVIFAVPAWPSFFSASRRGMTTVSS